MPRSMRNATLENRSNRLKLPMDSKRHWLTIGYGIALGYQRNKSGSGTWYKRVARGGNRGHSYAVIGMADDFDAADGDTILDFWAAQDKARAEGLKARQGDDGAGKLLTVAEAFDAYEAHLGLRGADAGNVKRVRLHLPEVLAAKTVALLKVRDFRPWTRALHKADLNPATINRVNSVLKAGLNHAAAHDERITTRAWKQALANIPDAVEARNVILDDSTTRAIVAAAYDVSPEFGLLVGVAAVTGARVSQLSRLEVRDLQAARPDPRLMLPSSKKGRGTKKITRRPVPIPSSLAVRLLAAAEGRAAIAPLLVKPGGDRWKKSDHSRLFRRAVVLAGLDNAEPIITLYALRHSSIVRALLAGTPIRLVAAAHDTSVLMIERAYSRHITDANDESLRRALLDLTEPVTDNVVALRNRP